MSPATPRSRVPETVPKGAPPARLAWLDALRGWAALVVALHHASYYFVPGLRESTLGWFDPGRYGVLVFFLVSGYIVPVSLERHGDVRKFWISRFFRIYPLVAVACAVPVTLTLLGVRELREGLGAHDPVVATLAHLTLLQDVLAVPNVINVLWTLTYEMAFYLIVVALYVTGAARRSVSVALLLVAGVLLVGGLAPYTLLSRTAGTGTVVLLTLLVLAAAVAAAMYGQRGLRVAGGAVGGLVAAALVVVNSRIGAWEGLAILAVMVTGTVIYRAEHGQIGRRAAVFAVTAVLAGTLAAGIWYAYRSVPGWQISQFRLDWSVSVALAAATFGGAWLLRRRSFPRWLTGLGTISFSVYLLHHVLLMLYDQFFGITGRDEIPKLLAYLAILLAVSCATYRWIEAPAQRLGRRLARRRRPGEGRVVGEDRLLQPLEGGAGVEPELVGEHPPALTGDR